MQMHLSYLIIQLLECEPAFRPLLSEQKFGRGGRETRFRILGTRFDDE